MAEFRYGYRTKFDEPTPVEEFAEPQFYKPNARVTGSNPQAANVLSKLPLKDPKIPFNIGLQQNSGSDPSKPIDAPTLFDKVSCMGRVIIFFPDLLIVQHALQSLILRPLIFRAVGLDREIIFFRSTASPFVAAVLTS